MDTKCWSEEAEVTQLRRYLGLRGSSATPNEYVVLGPRCGHLAAQEGQWDVALQIEAGPQEPAHSVNHLHACARELLERHDLHLASRWRPRCQLLQRFVGRVPAVVGGDDCPLHALRRADRLRYQLPQFCDTFTQARLE